ncbi:MAG TPA: CoA pyrophosphatase [Acidimicrobiales bacterium]|nr:CoA pyrophosphatase [Acidimicrobiales bacterium]
MSDPALPEEPDRSLTRGGPQIIPRPDSWRPGPGASWSRPGAVRPSRVTVADVRAALAARPDPPVEPTDEVPTVALPGPARRPAAVLCLLFDSSLGEGGTQCHVLLTRRSSRLRSHTHQVSFPGGRLDRGESLTEAALREANEEVGIDPSSVEIIGRLSSLRTVLNPSPITPFVGVVPTRPRLVPNPAEVERAFDVPLIELFDPEVYREELWAFPDGTEHPMQFFELIGDTVWGATARMLVELLDVVAGARTG